MLAAIDLGSNSFRLQIGEFVDGKMRIVRTAREPNRLAAGLDKKNHLTKRAFEAGIEAVRSLRSILDHYPLTHVRAVATYTLRIARNAPEFMLQAEGALGYPIEIISGEEEGRLIYLGVDNLLAQPDERRLVIDIGGGSTEIIRGEGKKIERVESFGVGTVGQSLSFFPNGDITKEGFESAILTARSLFEDAKLHYHKRNWQKAYGSSGTMRAIAEIIRDNQLGDGRLTLENLLRFRDVLIADGKLGKVNLVGLRLERGPSIIGGLSVMIALFQDLKINRMDTVESGLRMGIMWDLCLQSTMMDRREQSVMLFMRRFKVDERRAQWVAHCAAHLYESMLPDVDDFKKSLHWSALMHEVGIFISPSKHHKHGAYLVENADLAGFTAREQKQMGRFVLSQMGTLRKLNGFIDDLNVMKAVLALRLAVIFQHSRVTEDLKQVEVNVRKRIEILLPKKWLKRYPTLTYWLGRERDWWSETGVEFQLSES